MSLLKGYGVGTQLVEGQTIRGVCNALPIAGPLNLSSEEYLRRLSSAGPNIDYRLIVTDDYIVFHHDVALTRFLKEQVGRHSPVPIENLLELVDTDELSQWWSRDSFQFAEAFSHEHNFSGWFGNRTVTFYYYGIMLTPEHGIYYVQVPVVSSNAAIQTFHQMKNALQSIK